jgi:integrase
MMTDWYQRSINALQLNGKGERTQEAYIPRAAATGARPPPPMAKSSVQGAFRHAKRDAGVGKRGVSVHTLRHSGSMAPRG